MEQSSKVVPVVDSQAPSMITLIREKTASGELLAPAQLQQRGGGGGGGLIPAGSAALSDDQPPPSVQSLPGLGGPRSAAAPSRPSPGAPESPSFAARRAERVAGDHDDPLAAYPLPRFPVGHTSAAFDAVAARKSLILTPAEVYAECAHHGEEKARFGWLKLLVLSVVAGCYVGFGYTICLMVGGNLGADLYKERPGLFSLVFGAVGFPAGFTMIVVCGGELFTSMAAYSAAAWCEGRVTARACLRLLAVTWLGNFAGCAAFLGLILATEIFEGRDWYALVLAQKKVHHSFGSALVRGVFANWLVGVATFQANAAQDLSGKAVAIWLPISAFAMLGFEHVIANQYLLPLAIAYGAPISARDVIVRNFIPATLGNWLGGAACVAGVYALAFGTPNRRVTEWVAAVGAARHARAKRAALAAATATATRQSSKRVTLNVAA